MSRDCGYSRIYVWVEGPDDERFFATVIRPVLEARYDHVRVTSYAGMRPEKVSSFLRSIKSIPADYLFIADIHETPCVRRRIDRLQEMYAGLDRRNVIVVIREIEGWYLAGVSARDCTRIGVNRFHPFTDDLTKEMFNKLVPPTFRSRIDFMVEVLAHFDFREAENRNRSFRYVADKYELPGRH